MSHWRSQLNNYHGSTTLEPVAQLVGVQVDKFNFLLAGVASIGLGYLYSYLLPVGRVSVQARKASLIVIGLSILYFCFGRDVLHVVAEAAIGYALTKLVSIDQLPAATLLATLGYQSMCHLIRQYSDPDGYTIDITGAVMMLTQRVSTLAFSLRDGVRTLNLTADQRRDAVPQMPDALSYFAYMFDFHEVLAGPLISYNEFLRIAEGRPMYTAGERPTVSSVNNNVNGHSTTTTTTMTSKPGSVKVTSPRHTPHWEVARKLGYVALNAVLILKVVPLLTEREMLSDWYSALPFASKLFYLHAYSFLSRLQYYLVWKLAEAVCNSSGYGHYVTADGEERWDGADNIHIFRLETAPSLKVILDNWNVSTQRWLKHVCYDRAIRYRTASTFLLSAVWHGFYPGYFLAFMTCSLFVVASRTVRRSVRPRVVVHGPLAQRAYDVVTFAFSTLFLAYTTAPFVLLQFGKAIRLWRDVYFFGHVLALAAIFVLPRVLPPIRPTAQRRPTQASETNATPVSGGGHGGTAIVGNNDSNDDDDDDDDADEKKDNADAAGAGTAAAAADVVKPTTNGNSVSHKAMNGKSH